MHLPHIPTQDFDELQGRSTPLILTDLMGLDFIHLVAPFHGLFGCPFCPPLFVRKLRVRFPNPLLDGGLLLV